MTQPRILLTRTKHCSEYIFIDKIMYYKPADQGEDFKTLITLTNGHRIYSLDDHKYVTKILTQHGAIIL